MRNPICLLLLFFLGGPAAAQQLHPTWVRYFGSSWFEDISESTPATDKGVIFTGTAYGNGHDGDIPLFQRDTVGQNLMVAKLDSNKQIAWVKLYGGSGDEAGGVIEPLADGNFIILGLTKSNDGDVTGYHGGNGDFWAVKVDNGGNLLWQQAFGGPGYDFPLSVAPTADSGFVMLGISNMAGGDIPPLYSNNLSLFDWVVIKVDKQGNKQWVKRVGGTDDEYSYGKILAFGNNYYLIGGTYSEDNDCTDTAWRLTHSGANCYAYIIKLDSSGNVTWSKSYGGSISDAFHSGTFDRRDSSIVCMGSSVSNDLLISNPNYPGLTQWLLKTDLNGNVKWSKCFGNSHVSESWHILPVPQGYLVSSVEVGAPPAPPNHIGNDDVVLFLFDTAGNLTTNKNIGGLSYDRPGSSALFGNGFVTFGSTGSSQFIEGSTLVPKHGSRSDCFIAATEFWPVEVPELPAVLTTLKVFPNPAAEKVLIQVGEGVKAGRMDIIDPSGRRIYTVNQPAGLLTVDTWSWPKGLYIIRLSDAKGVRQSQKVLIR